jgi:preprotein translocase subunit SecG
MGIVMKLLLVVQLLSALAMIGLILVQHGKGADAGAAFGGGAGSASLFGASGGANFLSRSTAVLATVFLTSTLVLAYFGSYRPMTAAESSVLEGGAGMPLSSPASSPSSEGANQAPASSTSTPAGGAAQIPGK